MENETTEIKVEYELSPSERAEVRSRYPKEYFPDPVKEPLFFGRRDHQRIADKKVIFDQRAPIIAGMPAVFGICSERYKIVPYEDIIHMVENSVGKLTEFGTVQLCPHIYLGGARMKIGIKFPDMKHVIKAVDSIIPKVDVFTSYDLSTKLTGRFGAWQLKCTNGMGIWKTFKAFSKRHLQNLFLSELGETISGGLGIFGEQVDQWKLWADKKVNSVLYEGIWDELPFSKTERSKIEALPEIGTNLLLPTALKSKELDLWSLNSVLTQYATHEVKSELRRTDLEPMIARVMETAFAGGIKPKKVATT
jgi:hypothetical protein